MHASLRTESATEEEVQLQKAQGGDDMPIDDYAGFYCDVRINRYATIIVIIVILVVTGHWPFF